MLSDLLQGILTEIIAAILLFATGFIASKVPEILQNRKARRFFGSNIFSSQFKIVYSLFERIQEKHEGTRPYGKKFHDGTQREVHLFRKITTVDSIVATIHLSQALARLRRKPISVVNDTDALKDLNASFITIGGPNTNDLTRWILEEETNVFYKLRDIKKENSGFPSEIYRLSEQDNNVYRDTKSIRHALILKIKNSRFPSNYHFLCMGITYWGTMGASWYLANKWKDLEREFGDQEFGVVIQVTKGVITSAKRVQSTDQIGLPDMS